MRLPKQAHKNENPDSRQTNQLQNGYNLTQKPEFAFYQIQTFTWQKREYFPKKKIIPTLQYSICLAILLYHKTNILSIFMQFFNTKTL